MFVLCCILFVRDIYQFSYFHCQISKFNIYERFSHITSVTDTRVSVNLELASNPTKQDEMEEPLIAAQKIKSKLSAVLVLTTIAQLRAICVSLLISNDRQSTRTLIVCSNHVAPPKAMSYNCAQKALAWSRHVADVTENSSLNRSPL